MLNVPFTISDCNSFTQAGYIGQDVETCIERLLIESNYDAKATEHGIVVLDEFDKIARRENVNGRDVGGEGRPAGPAEAGRRHQGDGQRQGQPAVADSEPHH